MYYDRLYKIEAFQLGDTVPEWAKDGSVIYYIQNGFDEKEHNPILEKVVGEVKGYIKEAVIVSTNMRIVRGYYICRDLGGFIFGMKEDDFIRAFIDEEEL